MKKYYKKILSISLLAMLLLTASVPSITALENVPVQESAVMDEKESVAVTTDEGTSKVENDKKLEDHFLLKLYKP